MQDFIIRAVCMTLLHSLWQAVLLAAAAGCILLVTRKAGPALRYKLLCALMIVFVVTVAYTFCSEITAVNESNNQLVQILPDHTNTAAVSQHGGMHIIAGGEMDKLLNAGNKIFNEYSWVLVSLWFSFFLVRFVRLLLGMVNVDRLRYYKTNVVTGEWEQKFAALRKRLHIQQPVILMESALLKVPVLIGYLKPFILIPAGMLIQLSPEQAEVILLHELAHVRRHDYLVNLIQNAVDTIFFFNPAILWLSALLRNERECCCDDIALQETMNSKEFVQALVSFNQYSSSLAALPLSWVNGGKGQLLNRVQRIVTRKNSSLRSVELVVLLSVLLFGSSAFMLFHGTREMAGNRRATATDQLKPAKQTVAKVTFPAVTANTLPGPVLKAARPARHNVVLKKAAMGTNTMVNVIVAPPLYAVLSPLLPHETERNDNRSRQLDRLQEQLAALGYHENSDTRLQTFMDHGVTALFIKSFFEAGYTNVSMDQLLELRDHGVHAAFTSELEKQGYGTVSLQQAMTLVDHGVSISFIEGIKSLGFDNVSLQQATDLKDHGVTRTFIDSLRNKINRLLSLEDYIKLKDSGINPSS